MATECLDADLESDSFTLSQFVDSKILPLIHSGDITTLKSTVKSLQSCNRQFISKAQQFIKDDAHNDDFAANDLSNGTEAIQELEQQYMMLQFQLKNELEKASPILKQIDFLTQRFSIIASIEARQSIEQNCLSGAEQFMKLVDCHKRIRSYSCTELGVVTSARIRVLFGKLKHHFFQTTKDSLSALNWPQSQRSLLSNDPAIIEQFRSTIVALVKMQASMPAMHSDRSEQVELSDFDWELPDSNLTEDLASTKLWVMELLLQPIVKRFRFHFYGEKQTNVASKPEWFLTFILTAINDHIVFVEDVVKPVVDEFLPYAYDTRWHFIDGLVAEAKDKVKRRLSTLIMCDSALLRHTIDELLVFDRMLADGLDYDQGVLAMLASIPEADFLHSWLRVDKDFVNEHFSSILTSPHPFKLLAVHIPDQEDSKARRSSVVATEDLRPSRSADAVISLIHSEYDRYRLLPKKTDQLRFAKEIQCHFLHAYASYVKTALREHAKVLSKSSSSAKSQRDGWLSYCGLMNSLRYCELVVSDWSEQLFFVQLLQFDIDVDKAENRQTSKRDLEAEDGFFSECIHEFRSIHSDFLAVMVGLVYSVFEKALYAYKHQGFMFSEISIPESDNEHSSFDVSPPLCVPLSSLKAQLLNLDKNLNSYTHRLVWRRIASKLDNLFYDNIVKNCYFSKCGCLQFEHDMKALFSLFRPYTSAPHNFFRKLKDTLVLFSFSPEVKDGIMSAIASNDTFQVQNHMNSLMTEHMIDNIPITDAVGVCSMLIN